MLMMNKHCYLFALEINPMNVDAIYDDLPLHCTLMHRFWSELSPEELADKVSDFFKQFPSINLEAHERLLLGPKQVAVSEITLSDQLKQLHMGLYELLNDLGVEYTAPEWVGDGYRAHATEREDAKLEVGTAHQSRVAYLIEVKVPGYDHKRLIRKKIVLAN